MKTGSVLLVSVTLAIIFLAGCGLAGQRREVINYTTHAFCKLEERPNLSIYAPWDKKTRRIKLPPNGSIKIRDRGEKYILNIWTCDGRYMISNYNHRPEPGEPWILGEMDVWDSQQKYKPTPMATRIPVVLTIINDTGRDICSVRFSRWREPYQFSDNVLTRTMIPGDQIVLREPEDINWGIYVLKIYFCDETEYLTEAVVFEEIMAITLRGAEQDAHDLLVEKEGVE